MQVATSHCWLVASWLASGMTTLVGLGFLLSITPSAAVRTEPHGHSPLTSLHTRFGRHLLGDRLASLMQALFAHSGEDMDDIRHDSDASLRVRVGNAASFEGQARLSVGGAPI
jgi:hypothetical protein